MRRSLLLSCPLTICIDQGCRILFLSSSRYPLHTPSGLRLSDFPMKTLPYRGSQYGRRTIFLQVTLLTAYNQYIKRLYMPKYTQPKRVCGGVGEGHVEGGMRRQAVGTINRHRRVTGDEIPTLAPLLFGPAALALVTRTLFSLLHLDLTLLPLPHSLQVS